MPKVRIIAPEDIPLPYRSLLVHDSDMTLTLERHFGDRVVLRPLSTFSIRGSYYRRVLLVQAYSGRPVEMGAVLALSDRMQAEVRADAPAGWARIMVQRKDGRSDCLETTSPSGSPERPLSEEQLYAKFRDCAANAARVLSPEAIERAIHLVHNLAEAADATALIRLFRPAEKI